jgi:exopolysaccharide production protein ExoQ
MATAVIQPAAIKTTHSRSIHHLVLGWVLMFPLVFFAVHGTPSFEGAGNSNAGATSLAGLASNGRNAGVVGNIVIPGIAYSIVLWVLIINARRVIAQALQMRMLTLLALFTICSALWSQDPFRSAYNGAFYLIETLFAFYLVLRFDPEEILSIMMMAGVSISVLSLIMVFLFPRFGVNQSARDGLAWIGLFTDRTLTGKCMLYLLSPAIIFRRRSLNNRHMIYILLMSIMVFMAHAATARVILLLYIALMASMSVSRKFGRRSSLLIVGLVLAAGALIALVGAQFLPRVLGALGRNATLSGRTEIWNLVVGSIAKRPLLGYGYYSFWQGLKGESANIIVGAHWMFGYAHNGILEICLQLGLVGTALFFVTLVQAIGNAWFCLRNGCQPAVEWYIGIIALTLVYNIDESTVLWPIDILSLIYVVACCGLAMAARQITLKRKMGALSI